MQEEIKLSIIVPIYNSQDYLRTCLNSVTSCPSDQMECILVNDGSKDDSLHICEEYSRKDSRFRVIDKENEGASVARNTGILQATGTYLFFLDADDYLEVAKWDYILKVLDKGYDFVAFSYYTLEENNGITEELFPIKDRVTNDTNLLKKLLLGSAGLNTCWGKLLKRQTVIEQGIAFPEGLKTGEDAVFVIDYIEYVKTCLIENESILYYRQHSSSAMHRMDLEGKLNDLEILYQRRKDMLQHENNKELQKEAYRQFFSVITNLFLEVAGKGTMREAIKAYQNAYQRKMVQEIIEFTPYSELSPVYKKMEYQLIKIRWFGCLAVYFSGKMRFK